MPDELKDILSPSDDDIRNEQLLKYLNGQLNDEERHELEKQFLDNAFENDAAEGLQEVEDKTKIGLIVDGLNYDLRKRMAKKIATRKRRQLKPQWWLYFSILILLILLVLIYLYLHQQMNR